MNYLDSKIVLFPYQFPAVPSIFGASSEAYALIPPYVRNRILSNRNSDPVHIKHKGAKRELIILHFFPGIYEDMLGEKFSWVEPVGRFMNDLAEQIERHDNPIWIFANPEIVEHLKLQIYCVTCDFCIMGKITEDALLQRFIIPHKTLFN